MDVQNNIIEIELNLIILLTLNNDDWKIKEKL